MLTLGGAMSGKRATGSCGIAKTPAKAMKIAMTQAKTGRVMKNCDMGLGPLVWVREGQLRSGHRRCAS